MNAYIETGIMMLGATLIVAVLCGTFLYGCQIAEEAYERLAVQCINSGGSWIRSGNGGHCIHVKDKQP